jgi:hypothetical protein
LPFNQEKILKENNENLNDDSEIIQSDDSIQLKNELIESLASLKNDFKLKNAGSNTVIANDHNISSRACIIC